MGREPSDASRREDSAEFWESLLEQQEELLRSSDRVRDELMKQREAIEAKLAKLEADVAAAPERIRSYTAKVNLYRRQLFVATHNGKVKRLATLVEQLKALAAKTPLTEQQRDELYTLGVRL